MNPPELIQDWALFIGIVATAAGAILAAVGYLTRVTVVPALQREVEKQITLALYPVRQDLNGIRVVVDRELTPNGREYEGDSIDREAPMRIIALRAAARARRVDRRTDRIEQAVTEHEDHHIRADADWPRFYRDDDHDTV